MSRRITQIFARLSRSALPLGLPPSILCVLLLSWSLSLGAQSADPALDSFKRAWQSAKSGSRTDFQQRMASLQDYVLYPYLQYENYRFNRALTPPDEMAAFLAGHTDWAFTPALRKAWLLSLGETKRWDALLQYAPDEPAVEVQCYLAQAQIQSGQTEAATALAQELWAVGKSQPEVCDPVFDWLRKQGGISPELAWTRIARAMDARNPRMTLYLKRFVPTKDQLWVERWQQQDQQRYVRLDNARNWPDVKEGRDITSFGLKYVARNDADRAAHLFGILDGHYEWGEARRGEILREIALWSAVAHEDETLDRMHAVPAVAYNDAMLEWWGRVALATGNWTEVHAAVAAMQEPLRSNERWRYWGARANRQLGNAAAANAELRSLAGDASYYGFLAADALSEPYAICAEDPLVTPEGLTAFAAREPFQRVVALHDADLRSWSRSEWKLAVKNLESPDVRLAAAFATEQGWSDLAILALTRPGDRALYDWRFPLGFAPEVEKQASKRQLDASWVLGLMRSESAMAVDAVSPANARGLMQVLPGTAAQLAKRHSYPYHGIEQLMKAEDNIVFGTIFLRELMDRFHDNPVLATGAYNAGPGAVKRWLETLPTTDPAIWVEVLPYFETRDYIPRVLAFATIYDWRLEQPVRRISARMPSLDPTTPNATATGNTAEVQCPAPALAAVPSN